MFEVFDHTADLGLRARADDLGSLFAELGRAFASVLVSNPAAIEPRESVSITVPGSDLAYLCVDWLSELLALFETKRFLPGRFQVSVSDDGVSAVVDGERWDPAGHPLAHEIKAVTYHGLRVERDQAGWIAEVILDI
jgi:SHS2 domain-containing protein